MTCVGLSRLRVSCGVCVTCPRVRQLFVTTFVTHRYDLSLVLEAWAGFLPPVGLALRLFLVMWARDDMSITAVLKKIATGDDVGLVALTEYKLRQAGAIAFVRRLCSVGGSRLPHN